MNDGCFKLKKIKNTLYMYDRCFKFIYTLKKIKNILCINNCILEIFLVSKKN